MRAASSSWIRKIHLCLGIHNVKKTVTRRMNSIKRSVLVIRRTFPNSNEERSTFCLLKSFKTMIPSAIDTVRKIPIKESVGIFCLKVKVARVETNKVIKRVFKVKRGRA